MKSETMKNAGWKQNVVTWQFKISSPVLRNGWENMFPKIDMMLSCKEANIFQLKNETWTSGGW
jgi:hypothetical protein